jgi:hypothetical protein
MYFPKITNDPHDAPSGSFNWITARRKNDRVYIFGETKRQCLAIRKLLMKSARHFNETLLEVSDFFGLDEINTTNAELLECLSSPPDPYSGVNVREALVAAMRDARIIQRVLTQNPTIEQLFTIQASNYDWGLYFRCNHPTVAGRERFAKDLEGMLEQLTENRRRYEQIKGRANGHEH